MSLSVGLSRRGRARAGGLAGALGLACACLVAPASSRAQPKGDTCPTAYEQAQQLVKERSPLRARAELRLCLSACPTVLARDCAAWLAEVEPQVASIRIATESASGAPATGDVAVDGAPIARDVTSVEVDPGEHEVTARDAQGGVVEAKVTVTAGQRDVPVLLRFPDHPPPPPPPLLPHPLPLRPPPSRVVPWVLGGVGLAGMAVGGALGIAGQVQRSHLVSTCAPSCRTVRLQPIRTEWTAGGIAAGAGAVTAIIAVTWLALQSRGTSTVALSPGEPPRLALTF